MEHVLATRIIPEAARVKILSRPVPLFKRIPGRAAEPQQQQAMGQVAGMAAVVLILLLQLVSSYPSAVHAEASVLGRKAGAVDGDPAAANAPPAAGLERWPGRYAVIFDAGSTGSRVHIFKFNRIMDLVPVHGEIEVFTNVRLLDDCTRCICKSLVRVGGTGTFFLLSCR